MFQFGVKYCAIGKYCLADFEYEYFQRRVLRMIGVEETLINP